MSQRRWIGRLDSLIPMERVAFGGRAQVRPQGPCQKSGNRPYRLKRMLLCRGHPRWLGVVAYQACTLLRIGLTIAPTLQIVLSLRWPDKVVCRALDKTRIGLRLLLLTSQIVLNRDLCPGRAAYPASDHIRMFPRAPAKFQNIPN